MAMMGFGFVVARFGIFLQELQPSRGGPSPHGSLWFGTALVLMGVSVNVVAALQHTRLVHRLRHGTWSPTPSRAGLALALGLALVGLAVAVHILWLAAGVR
jgi:putative membrane protein